MSKNILIIFFLLCSFLGQSASILIPMDSKQKDHLKSYGLAFYALQNGAQIHWLLNYRGGSFLIPWSQEIKKECLLRGISFKRISDSQAGIILNKIASPSVNMDAMKMEKSPKIAVYSPSGKKPWDDAVTMVLSYAQIEYEIIYDEQIVKGELEKYDWLHLHHEDFTGQYGKFYSSYRHMNWYKNQVKENTNMAHKLGFEKVSELKKTVSETIRNFVSDGGFLFAMCSATDTYDIALAAHSTDICSKVFDGDAADADAQQNLDYNRTFAFQNFKLETNPYVYEYSDIDMTSKRKVNPKQDYFSLFEFSAKWDPIPTMLCQNHVKLIKGFMGQTTSFNSSLIKPEVLIMGENKAAHEARYIHGTFGNGTWTFYGGHDPEDYQHLVGDPATDLNLHKNSPGYRLILNNILFPSAKKKKRKT